MMLVKLDHQRPDHRHIQQADQAVEIGAVIARGDADDLGHLLGTSVDIVDVVRGQDAATLRMADEDDLFGAGSREHSVDFVVELSADSLMSAVAWIGELGLPVTLP